MLRIYTTVIDFIRSASPIIAQIGRHDRDLTRQFRRASVSVALNLAEGQSLRGGSRRLRYLTALGSATEVRACLDVAEALGYIQNLSPNIVDDLNKIQATLYKLSR